LLNNNWKIFLSISKSIFIKKVIKDGNEMNVGFWIVHGLKGIKNQLNADEFEKLIKIPLNI
jgi:hypothetical protein